MLPAAYQLPAAVVLLAGGFLACFFGYRLFKVVLGVFGFIIGALAASSVFGATDTTPMVIAAIVGGIAGAALLLAAYFVGVALVGAGIGALLVNVIWTQIEGDPHPAVVILFSVAGAVVATWLQRYVIILGTAFGGAWTMLVGGLALMGDSGPLRRPRPATCGWRIRSIPRRACDGCRGRGSRSARSARWCRCDGPAASADASAKPNKKKAPKEEVRPRRLAGQQASSASGFVPSGIARLQVRSDTHLRFASPYTSHHTA